jgi:hypothetical protein
MQRIALANCRILAKMNLVQFKPIGRELAFDQQFK